MDGDLMKSKISMFYLLLYLGMGTLMPFMSLFLNERGFDGREIGIILAAGSLAGIIAQPVFGFINDASRDYRTLLKVSLFLSAIVVLGYFFSESLVVMIITAVLFSFINTPTGPIIDAIAVASGPSFGFSYGQVRVWGAIGFSAITVIAGYVFSTIGFKYISLGYAVFALLMFLMIFTFPKIERPKRPAVLSEGGIGAVFFNWRFILFVAICMMVSVTRTMNFSYFSIYFKELHYPVDLVGWNFTIAAAVEIPLFWLSSKVIRRLRLFPMLIIGTCAYAVKYIVMGFAPPFGVVLSLQALDGLGFAFYMSSVVEIVNLMAPEHAKATSQTVFAAAGGIAGIAANLAGGLIVDNKGPQFLFLLIGGIALISVLLFILFPGKQNYHQDLGFENGTADISMNQ
jgi:MFS transporter, PPP family, 3-phenylpropionic acid transporter